VIHKPEHVAVHFGSSAVRVQNAFLNVGRTCNTEIGMEKTDDECVAGGVRVGLGAQVLAPQGQKARKANRHAQRKVCAKGGLRSCLRTQNIDCEVGLRKPRWRRPLLFILLFVLSLPPAVLGQMKPNVAQLGISLLPFAWTSASFLLARVTFHVMCTKWAAWSRESKS
jgi:hypothetical protein